MAINHTVELYTTSSDEKEFRLLLTKAKYVRPYIINMPISDSGQLGINGGFFGSDDYNEPPESEDANYPSGSCGRSISWAKNYTKTYPYNGTATNHYSRGTVVISTNTSTQKTLAEVISADSVATINSLYPSTNISIDAMIGGGELAVGSSDTYWKNNVYDAEGWTSDIFPCLGEWEKATDIYTSLFPSSSARRCGLGLKTINNEKYICMAVSTGNASIYHLRHLFDELGCYSGIFLDGSHSVQMRWKDSNNVIQEDISNPNSPRYIWNMVMLTNKN